MWQEQMMVSWSWNHLLYWKMWSPYLLKQGCLKGTLKNLAAGCFHSGPVSPRFWWGPHGRWWGLIHWWTPDQREDRHALGGRQGVRASEHLAFLEKVEEHLLEDMHCPSVQKGSHLWMSVRHLKDDVVGQQSHPAPSPTVVVGCPMST